MEHLEMRRTESKPPETTHFYYKTTENHFPFFKTQLKSVKKYSRNTANPVPLVRPIFVSKIRSNSSME